MANSVNGQAAITLDSHRERTGIQLGNGYLSVYAGEVLQARFSLDTLGDFTIDAPNAISGLARNWNTARIFLVGLVYSVEFAHVFSVKSGANTLTTLSFSAHDGPNNPVVTDSVLLSTNPGEALIFNATHVSGTNVLRGLAHYVIADAMRFSC